MKRIAAAAYGLLGYLAFLLPIAYLAGFLADVGVPRSVDRGAGPLGPPLPVDLALILAFGLQHSIMARPGFKAAIRRWVPDAFERTTYVLASGGMLVLLFWLWRPLPAVIWDVTGTPVAAAAWTGFAAGWALAVWATFALSHLHLFGVSQVVAWVRGRPHPNPVLRNRILYRIVRHPMTAGLLLVFWCTPRMTLGHLILAAGMTVYSLVATALEERDLLRRFGDSYRAYRARVPALVPFLPLAGRMPAGRATAAELVLVGAVALGLAAVLPGRSMTPPPLPGPLAALALDSASWEGRTRKWAVHAPIPGGGPRPVLLALHGTGGDAKRLQAFLGGELERRAREDGWLVVYPEGWRGAWNGCRRRAPSRANRLGIDDVGFLRAVVARLAEAGLADPSRVHALGYSGGGHMALRLALEAPDLVRSVAIFGASVPADPEMGCSPAPSVAPVLVVNGTDDLVNPWDGGDVIAPNGTRLGRVRSSAATIAYLRDRSRVPDAVRLVEARGGGHGIPGRTSRFPPAAGRILDDLDGVSEALRFFRRVEEEVPRPQHLAREP